MSNPVIPFDAAGIDEIHAIFESLIAFMGEKWITSNVYANRETSGATNCGITCTDPSGSSFSYSERIVPGAVPAEP